MYLLEISYTKKFSVIPFPLQILSFSLFPPPPFFDGKICFIPPTSLILTVNKYFSTSVQGKHNS